MNIKWENKMGIVTNVLGKANFKDNKSKSMSIEMNKGDIVHLQNETIRIEMNVNEFYEFASTVINGANGFIDSKENKSE